MSTKVAALAVASFVASVIQGQAGALPTITTARAAHELSLKESLRAYPVRLRAVVTLYNPFIDPRHPALFVADSTAAVFVELSAVPPIPLREGQLIEVAGVSGPGDFAPIVTHAVVRVIAQSRLPNSAPQVSLTRMLSGTEDGQWVEIEGVVRSLLPSGRNVFLTVALSDGNITAGAVTQPGSDYSDLVDAKIRLRGNVAPIFNRQRQMTGVHILFPGLATLQVEDPAPPRPFEANVSSAASVLQFGSSTAFPRRVHLRGAVSLLWPGRTICIQDGAQGLCAQTSQTTRVVPGESVDLIGFPTVGPFTPTLTSASYRYIGRTAQPIPIPVITQTEALQGNRDAKLVAIEGKIVGLDPAAHDPAIMLSSLGKIFSAVLPHQSGARLPSAWQEGTVVRVVGICSVQPNTERTVQGQGFTVPDSFRILMRSSADVVIVQKRSWWTAANALWVLAAAMLAILGTAVALFWKVRQCRSTASKLSLEVGERRLAQDATKFALEQMDYQAHHDPLTSLANRLLFNRSMRDLLALAEKTSSSVGLLYLDLDRFKAINDSLGHAAGDMLLKQAAERLSSVSPPGSVLSRLGGDEFAFLLPNITMRSHAEATAQSVVDVMAAPFIVDGVPWHCPASVGVSLFPDDAQSAAVLQRNADTALYRAKRISPGHFVTFDHSMSEQAERSLLVENAMRRGVNTGSFSLAYQPQFAAQGGLFGFEVLLRLEDEVLGAISPAEFITIAEEIGLISPIGEWVLEEACRQWAAWASEARISISLNISPVQLKRGNFPALVEMILTQTGMPPELLELEIAESNIPAVDQEKLLKLKALGVRIAVDGFGTGCSSLSKLEGSPVNCVKIDRSFVRDSAALPGTSPVIRNIVSAARALGMQTVATGIETQSQLDAVKEAGCDILQGFLLSYPLTAANAGTFLQDHQRKIEECQPYAGRSSALPTRLDSSLSLKGSTT